MTVSDSLFVSCPLIGQSKTKRTFSQGTFLKDEPLDLGGKVIWIFFIFCTIFCSWFWCSYGLNLTTMKLYLIKPKVWFGSM